MRKFVLLFFLVGIGSVCGADPVVSDGASLEMIQEGFRFTEGPAWDGNEHIFFSDIPENKIYRYNVESDEMEVFREETGGANGLMFDGKGRLVMCEGGNRRVTRLEQDGSVTVLADKWKGKKLNSPNDLVIRENGGIYFTDPRYGNRSTMELDVEAVYYISPEGELRQVIDDLVRPNGLILSRDGSVLYVADHGDKKTWAYDVGEDGSLSDKRLFAKSGSDGVTIDDQGNVYLTSGDVLVYNSEGKKITTIDMPRKPSNVTFGPPDARMLYITAREGFYRIPTKVKAGR